MAETPIVYSTEGAAGKPVVVVHGGAGRRRHPFTPEREQQAAADIKCALDAAMAVLDAGGSALDAVVAGVHVMEDAPEFNAGRGAALTSEGRAEMDSCVMTGDGRFGAVAGADCVRNPIDAARAVMEKTPHVLMVEPTEAQCEAWGVETAPQSYFILPERVKQLAELQALPDGGWDKPGHGTIVVVARDAAGNIAAGTSTGGVTNQQPGRVGDSPIAGAGTYANQQTLAVSCTGTGERFIQESAGYQLHARVLWAGQTPSDAAKSVLEAVEDRGGDGGLICIPVEGEAVVAHNACAQMDWGYAFGDVRVTHN